MKKLSGDLAAARDQYLRAIALGREVLAAHPDDANSRENLAVALDDLGGISATLGDPGGACALLLEAEQLFGELIEADPENVELQIKLALSRCKLGALECDEGRYDRAEEHYRRAVDHLLRLEGEGRIGHHWEYGRWSFAGLKEDLAYCRAAPGALESLDAARDHPPPLARRLLLLHARRRACAGAEGRRKGGRRGVVRPGERMERQPLPPRLLPAQALGSLDDGAPGTVGVDPLRIRAADLAVDALSRAVDAGTCAPSHLDADPTLVAIRAPPGLSGADHASGRVRDDRPGLRPSGALREIAARSSRGRRAPRRGEPTPRIHRVRTSGPERSSPDSFVRLPGNCLFGSEGRPLPAGTGDP